MPTGLGPAFFLGRPCPLPPDLPLLRNGLRHSFGKISFLHARPAMENDDEEASRVGRFLHPRRTGGEACRGAGSRGNRWSRSSFPGSFSVRHPDSSRSTATATEEMIATI